MNTKQQKKDTMPLQQLNRRRFIKNQRGSRGLQPPPRGAASLARMKRVGVGMIGLG